MICNHNTPAVDNITLVLQYKHALSHWQIENFTATNRHLTENLSIACKVEKIKDYMYMNMMHLLWAHKGHNQDPAWGYFWAVLSIHCYMLLDEAEAALPNVQM